MTRPFLRASLAVAAFALLSGPRADAQSFAVGGGAAVVNDTGSAARIHSFQTWGGSLFGELELERDVLLQVRGSIFTIPGSEGAPNERVTAVTATVSYLFREEWFAAGVFGGLGGYFLRPRSPAEGQTALDVNENAFGWTGGIVTIFDVGARWDVRVEGTGHLMRTTGTHTPIQIGLSAAYHF
jgi:hypothetical protein